MFCFTWNTVISSMKIDQAVLCKEMNGTNCDKSTNKTNNLCMRNSDFLCVKIRLNMVNNEI